MKTKYLKSDVFLFVGNTRRNDLITEENYDNVEVIPFIYNNDKTKIKTLNNDTIYELEGRTEKEVILMALGKSFQNVNIYGIYGSYENLPYGISGEYLSLGTINMLAKMEKKKLIRQNKSNLKIKQKFREKENFSKSSREFWFCY